MQFHIGNARQHIIISALSLPVSHSLCLLTDLVFALLCFLCLCLTHSLSLFLSSPDSNSLLLSFSRRRSLFGTYRIRVARHAQSDESTLTESPDHVRGRSILFPWASATAKPTPPQKMTSPQLQRPSTTALTSTHSRRYPLQAVEMGFPQ